MGDENKVKNMPAPEQGRDRQYVRTSDSIPVYYEPLNGDESPAPEWELMFEGIDPKPEENPRLYELLFDINQKLNILINHISGKDGFNMPEAKQVDISGGGLKFLSNDEFKPGERLTLKTFLPTYGHVLRIKCEVLRVVPGGEGGYEIAVKYVDMDETTRDKIIRYVFARQRRLLRFEKS